MKHYSTIIDTQADERRGLSMRSIEITRSGALSIADHLAEIQRWLDHANIRAADLQAIRILRGRVTFSAMFARTIDADRFLRAFSEVPLDSSGFGAAPIA
jgi:hypothetical protein